LLDLVTYVLWICDLDVKSGDLFVQIVKCYFFF